MNQSETEKYIGLVKWFHDHAKKANYGFIQHVILGDLFFHEKSIEQGQDITSIKENEVVVFITKPSKKHEGKLEAIKVKLLSNEMDLNFLFNHFLSYLTENGYYLENSRIQKVVHTRIKLLLEKAENIKIYDELFEKFQSFVNDQLQLTYSQTFVFLKELFNICKIFFPEKYSNISRIVELKIGANTAHRLWLDKYIDTCQVDFISSKILTDDIDMQRKILVQCSNEEKLNIFYKIIRNIEKNYTEFDIETIKEFLKLTKNFANIQYEEILNETLRICPIHYKLRLWLEDYHTSLQFQEYKLFTKTLDPVDQKKFVKKVLKYIHEEKVVISVEELTSINIIDYETSKLAMHIDNSKLDYSTSIILNTILELNSQTQIETRMQILQAKFRIYDLILNQIKEPTDILEIQGYFDECEGRCSVSIKKIEDNEGNVIDKEITYQRNEHNKPKLHPICDGKKSLVNNLTPALAEDTNLEFWWCANQKCYKPSRTLHKSEQWEKYTLLDFLTILKVNFREKDLEIYLNLINKANRFLKHLYCRECKHILRPVRQSNYAFYGVNHFHCTNENCKEKGKEIYLTHCLNGKCEHEIDSRDSVKCKPEGYDTNKYGWYVCNYCHACCSNEGIKRRQYILHLTGQEYKGHLNGHKDLGIISCNKCGNEMITNNVDNDKFQEALNWFIRNKNSSKLIITSGQNRNEKYWFLFSKANLTKEEYKIKLNNLFKLGFQIPDYYQDKDVQLVSEPHDLNRQINEIFTCKECGHIIDLSIDPEKAIAFKTFHNVRFA